MGERTGVRGYMGSAGVRRLPRPGQTGSRRPSFGVFEDDKNDRNPWKQTDLRGPGNERGPPPICPVGVRYDGRGVDPGGGPPQALQGYPPVDAAAAVLAGIGPPGRGGRWSPV